MADNNTIQTTSVALNFHEGSIPAWVQLTPAGPEITGRDGRVFKLNNPQAVVEAFVENGADLPIDYEHATQIKGAEGDKAPAVGWIKEVEVRSGALWGRVEWTSAGQWSVGDREYRYLSPAFAHEKKTGEIKVLISAGLTNTPNFEMAALNKQGAEQENEMDKAVLEALGLPATATAADAVVAINKINTDHEVALNSARQVDATKFVPKADYDLALNKITSFEEAEKEQVEVAINSAVDAAIEAGKISPASRDFYVSSCKATGGVDAFNEMIGGAPKIVPDSGLDKKDPEKLKTALTAEDVAVCNAMGMDEAEFAKAKAEEV